MTIENMTVKISVPLEGAIGQYLQQFPGKTRAAIVSMIVADYLSNGGCFGARGPVMAPAKPSTPAKVAPPKPVIREPEAPHSPPPTAAIIAIERPLDSPSSARSKVSDCL